MPSTTKTIRSRRSGSATSSPADTSRPDESTREASQTSPQLTLLATASGISSPASADGPPLCGSQVSPMMPTSGLARVHASRSRTRARGSQNATLDIFGQHGSSSSASAALQSSLENRLRASSAFGGSILFELTWNDAVTPSGHRICALRASARRTSGNAFTSWPSPVTNDAKGSDYTYANGDHERPCLKLGGAAKLATWWPTPIRNDAKQGKGSSPQQQQEARGAGGLNLSSLVSHLGPTSNGSPAPTAKRGQLNPDLSRWLMGYPVAWLFAAPSNKPTPRFRKSTGTTALARSPDSETRSSRGSLPRSSARRSRHGRR
jgi:hypothetical protein